MKVVIDEDTEKIYLKRFNISPDKVINVIENPDSKQIINFPNITLIYVLKKFDKYYLLIECSSSIDLKDEIKVDRVFIVGEQLLQNISIENPLKVIKLFANEFGYLLEIANQIDKFIQNIEIRILQNHHTPI